jgi:hypothetical protein
VFLCEKIGRVRRPANVSHVDLIEFVNSFADYVLTDVHVVHSFHAGSVAPVDSCLIVIEQKGWAGRQ